MAFAGLGAIVAFQVDVGPDGRALVESLSVGALVAAAVVCAMVGVLVALPAVRLRGLYLALATYAFAVVVSNMVFKQASSLQLNIPFVGDGEDIEVNLFTSGVLGVPRPRWFGIDLTRSDDLTQTAWLVFLAAAFALLGVMLVALRRSSYGLRLAALRDSPAAAATLGMNLVRLKTSVFALSAAIAGIGGALMAANQGSVREGDFDVFIGLGLFMLVAVGGVGYVTGALLGGLLFGAGFVVIGDLWAKLADEITTLGPVLRFLEDWFLFLGPAMAGIGLGGNPSGIAARLFEPYAVLKRRDARGAVAIGGSLLAGWYVLAVLGVIGNWIFVIGAALILVAMPRWYFTRHPELDPTRRPRPADVEALDRVGLTDDIDDAQAGAIDRLLELDRLRARVGVGS
jgi:ABC-type branched-subunit amino acid transport system permease subunit